MTNTPKPPVIVWDEGSNLRALIGEILREDGFIVHEVSEPRKLLNLYSDYPEALVLLGVSSPNLEGMEQLFYFRETYPKARVVLIFECGQSEGSTLHNMALRLGAKAILTKPFLTKELLQIVKTVA